jgi:predicted TIM-barrel fold metal-dependent hydrolase
MPRYRCFSADSHVVEPAHLYDGLVERFGDRAPHIAPDPRGKRGPYIVVGDKRMPIGRFGIAGHDANDPETDRVIARGYDGFRAGVMDPVERLNDQDLDGILGEVLYPTVGMLTGAVMDPTVALLLSQRYNDWLADYCSHAPERLIGIASVALRDVDDGVRELQRAARLGLRGVAIWCTAPEERPYSSLEYDRFWAAAADAHMPVTFHIFTGADGMRMRLPHDWDWVLHYALAHTASAVSLATVITSGVLERHPALSIISAEFDTGWLAHFIERLDFAVHRTVGHPAQALPLTPSEYFRRQCFATFEDDAIGVATRDWIGVDRLMWGNDYPHHDSLFPESQRVLARLMDGVPSDEQQRMLLENVCALYGISVPATPDSVAG